jgi:hypothetical protein
MVISAAIAPLPRPTTSMLLPMDCTSAVPTLTTSPVVTSRASVWPSRAAWVVIS